LTGRRAFAWAVFGVAAFIAYGSLVPFQFRARPFAHTTEIFFRVLSAGVSIYSRSDTLANVLLGIPLGFALLGFACVDRGYSLGKTAKRAIVLFPLCVLFSMAVEYAQLYTQTRHCTASDIAAQSLGSLVGMLGWLGCGQAFTNRVRAIATRADLNAAGQMLVAYVLLVAFIQTLPFDVSASPADLYRKFRDGGVRYKPFAEFDGLNDAGRWQQFAKLAKLAALFFPVGLLASRLKGRVENWNIVYLSLAFLGVAFCLESMQLVVKSRTPSTTDVIAGAFAALGGWYAGRVHHEGLAIPFAFSWGIVWFAGMTPITQPVAGTPRREIPREFDWMPGLPLESGEPLHTLEEFLMKLVLFGLLGVIVASWWLPPRERRGKRGSLRIAVGIAVILGLAFAWFFEQGQRWYDNHTPCITDVLLGGLGSALAVIAASRVCTPNSGKPLPAKTNAVC
jgi:glycopeptide antibiotics resistance protein